MTSACHSSQREQLQAGHYRSPAIARLSAGCSRINTGGMHLVQSSKRDFACTCSGHASELHSKPGRDITINNAQRLDVLLLVHCCSMQVCRPGELDELGSIQASSRAPACHDLLLTGTQSGAASLIQVQRMQPCGNLQPCEDIQDCKLPCSA